MQTVTRKNGINRREENKPFNFISIVQEAHGIGVRGLGKVKREDKKGHTNKLRRGKVNQIIDH